MAALHESTTEALVAAFEARFGAGGAAIRVATAPGRANLIGEHTDYQEGLVMPFALEQRVRVAFRPRTDGVLRAVALDLGDGSEGADEGEVALAALRGRRAADARAGPDVTPRWFRYVAAAWDWLEFADGSRCDVGCDLVLTSTVPRGGGVSSSSAVVVASALAARACNGAKPLTARPDGRSAFLMAICEAEWHYSGLGGGMMDQTASLYGRPDRVFAIDCRLGALAALDGSGDPYVAADGAAFVVFNTMVAHALPDSPYAKRRASCERVAAAMAARWPERSVTHLRDASDLGDVAGLAMVDALETDAAISAEDAARAKHGVAENNRVRAASAALRARDWARLGALMSAAHASLRDLYGVSCLELDLACEIAWQIDGCLGCRMMGGGFGGCVIALCEPAKAAAVAADLQSGYKARTAQIAACGAPDGIDATAFVSVPGAGATLDGEPAVDAAFLWASTRGS